MHRQRADNLQIVPATLLPLGVSKKKQSPDAGLAVEHTLLFRSSSSCLSITTNLRLR